MPLPPPRIAPVALAGPLSDVQAAEVRALTRSAAQHDGIAALSEQALLDLTQPGSQHWLLRSGHEDTPSGALVGYAQLGDTAGTTVSAELVVAPAARRSGIGRALLTAVSDHARNDGHDLLVWAHGDLPGAAALTAGAGLAPVRDLWRMTRDLADVQPAPPIPGLRTFIIDQDEDTWVELNQRAFAAHPEQGRLTRADLRAREHEEWFNPDDLLFVDRDGRAIAYLWLKVELPLGELYALGVSPDAQGGRLGSRLTAHAVAHLAARGADQAVLYVDADNAPAVRSYTAAGFRQERVDVQYGARAPRTSSEDATMPS